MRVLVLAGPTGSGKSRLAAELFDPRKFVIINIDSQQVYRDLPIGTSQPTPAQLAAIEHRLYGFAECGTRLSAGQFSIKVDAEIADVHDKGRMPVLVGGAGLYIRSVISGLDDLPEADAGLRERLAGEIREKGTEFLHKRLEKLDPAYAAVISRNDKVRIVRALEIYELSGLKLGELRNREKKPRYDAQIIGLEMDRESMYDRINKRTVDMLGAGWIDETKAVIAKGSRDWLYGLPAIGYRHIIDFLEGKHPRERMIELIQTDTRHYAKRQMTWFRKMKAVEWAAVDGEKIPEKLRELVYSTNPIS